MLFFFFIHIMVLKYCVFVIFMTGNYFAAHFAVFLSPTPPIVRRDGSLPQTLLLLCSVSIHLAFDWEYSESDSSERIF